MFLTARKDQPTDDLKNIEKNNISRTTSQQFLQIIEYFMNNLTSHYTNCVKYTLVFLVLLTDLVDSENCTLVVLFDSL